MKQILIFVFILFYNYSFGIKPSRKYIETPETYGFKYIEKQIQTPDNIKINLWDISPNKANSNNLFTIVICSTDAGNMSYVLNQSINLADKGFHVISFDYRGFGKSDDFKIDTTLLFHNEFLIDVETALKFAKGLYPQNKLGTLGFSMGGYFPLITTEKLDFIIGDSPLISPKNSIIRDREMFKGRILNLPLNYIEPKATIIIPQLYFIGNQDNSVRIDELPNNFAILYKGNHLEASDLLKDTYYDLIENFLVKLPQ